MLYTDDMCKIADMTEMQWCQEVELHNDAVCMAAASTRVRQDQEPHNEVAYMVVGGTDATGNFCGSAMDVWLRSQIGP